MAHSRSVASVVADKAVPQTFRFANEHFKEADQIHVALLGVLARKAPYPYRGSLRVNYLRPPCKSNAWNALQARVEPNNLLVSPKDVPVEEEANHFLTDVANQIRRFPYVHPSILARRGSKGPQGERRALPQ